MSESGTRLDALLKQLIDEYVDRLQRNERPRIAEYVKRHPELADRIEEIFPTLGLVELFKPDSGEITDDVIAASGPVKSGIPMDRLGDFRILREVGRGGMGIVYEAEQETLGRHVALKVLPSHAARDDTMVERFRREARAVARLHHTNIVPVFEVGEVGGVCFYAMQFIQGQGLELVIEEVKRLRDRSRQEPNAEVPLGTTMAPVAESPEPQLLSLQVRQVSQVARSLVSGRFASADANSDAVDPNEFSTSSSASSVTAATVEKNVTDGTEETGAVPAAVAIAVQRASTSAVLPGGRLLQSVESSHEPYHLSVAQIGQQAANALAYSHERGIVHRDIKPSNLLLDTTGVVWLTDFGLAKDEADGLTDPGALVGTLRYMAPERFQGQADGRADVYALGLTLYDLLTLQPAFQARDRLQLIEQIKSADPKPPRNFDERIPLDLETIVLKAIEKEPARRYQNAKELAEDLRLFADDQPILARKSTLEEKISRWHRRNPVVAALLWTLLIVLSSGLIGMTWLYRSAESQRQRAEANFLRAEANFRDAQSAVDDYLTRVSQQKLLDVPDMQPLRKELYESALKYYQKFILQHARDPRLRSDLANAYERVGVITDMIGARPDALKAQNQALSIRSTLADDYPENMRFRQDVAKSTDLIGNLLTVMGRVKEAEQSFLRAIKILESLIGNHPDVASLQQALARSYNNLGTLQKAIGRLAEAERSYRRSVEILERGTDRNDTESADRRQALAKPYANLAGLKAMTGEMAEAGQWFQKAVPILEALTRTHPNNTGFWQDLGMTHGNVGIFRGMTGRAEEAAQSYRQAITIQERLSHDHPSVVEFQQDLAKSYADLGSLLSTSDKTEAAKSYQRAIDIQEPLVHFYPEDVPIKQYLGRSYSALGMIQIDSDHTTAAMKSLQQAVAIQVALIRDHPNMPENRSELGVTYLGLGKVHRALQQPAEALSDWENTVRLVASLAEPGAYNLYNQACAHTLSSTVIAKARGQSNEGAEDAARKCLDKAMDALRRAVAAGWSDAHQMESDTRPHGDLEPLRSRPEFQKLIKSIQVSK